MDCNTPGLPVHHQFLEFTQTHVHRVGDAIIYLILYYPLLLLPSIFPSIRVFSNEPVLCIRWASGIGASASTLALPMNIQDWFPLGWTGWISLLSKGLSRVFSNTTVKWVSILQCSTVFIVQHSQACMATGKSIVWLDGPLLAKECLCFLMCCLGCS